MTLEQIEALPTIEARRSAKATYEDKVTQDYNKTNGKVLAILWAGLIILAVIIL